ncbi:hypothetical protein K7X08_018975 [Anisodus acutangulus]|uniref:CCT domain-containing protein n=1 Tax=Anisodus acutangulus TaxID=402998 RepID=A0A9Q1RA29_9SOLA|nr:hypothetical protein K7X08_018975 [Anisodus acutangulus]
MSDTEYQSVPPKNRKSKTRYKKRRKPKFLSLSLELSEKKTQTSDYMVVSSSNGSNHDHHQDSHQLNLFPLHLENLVDDKDNTAHDENVALFFAGAENSATTLNELLVSSKNEIDSNISTSVPNYISVSSEEASLTFADTYRGQQGALVRTALRNKEREQREEEKWVVYSDVVDFDQHSETTRKDEEVSSCPKNKHHQPQQQLSLKLDYEEILNAWSDKGPLYLQSESPQIVPDIHDDFLTYETPFSSHGLMGSSAVLYRVPEIMGSEQSESIQMEEDVNLKAGRREASVMRYKEKRQNRLFSKTIRYQVRKLNAEKRPRVKGRFVKRD